MDLKSEIVLDTIKHVGHPIRLPTAEWLLCDVLGCLDFEARESIRTLQDEGALIIDKGGWLVLKKDSINPSKVSDPCPNCGHIHITN